MSKHTIHGSFDDVPPFVFMTVPITIVPEGPCWLITINCDHAWGWVRAREYMGEVLLYMGWVQIKAIFCLRRANTHIKLGANCLIAQMILQKNIGCRWYSSVFFLWQPTVIGSHAKWEFVIVHRRPRRPTRTNDNRCFLAISFGLMISPLFH